MQSFLTRRPVLYTELLILMVGVPWALSTVVPIRYMLPILWLVVLYCVWVLRHADSAAPMPAWKWDALTRTQMIPMLQRFALSTALLVGLTLWLAPELFLGFVKARPAFWALVMVAYPLLSVIPQEIIFRRFFFARYVPIFTTPTVMVVASGVLFGAAHLIFQNWVAPLLCVIGGIMFAQTYARTRSLALVCVEHALYGCMLFTLGLGRYFYHGAVGPQ